MLESVFEIVSNRNICANTWEMVLRGETCAIAAPGQFVQILLDKRYLRRPISVCDVNGSLLTLVYKVVGSGTRDLSEYPVGRKLDLLTGLGNGYDLESTGDCPLIVGGGAGIPPMLYLAKRLIAQGKRVTAVLGFNTFEEIFYVSEFEKIGAKTIVTTVDGSFGVKGFVTDAMKGVFATSVCACGPMPMLKAVSKMCTVPAQFSLEERMGCGFGACMGCTIQTAGGARRVCKDGPVFRKEEILW